MSNQSTARRINVAALLATATGVFVRTVIIGVLLPLMISVGGIASGTTIDILNGEVNRGAILGTVIQYPALITAIVAGTMAIVAAGSTPTRAIARDGRRAR